MDERSPPGPDATLDGALGGAVRVVQPRKGFRFSIDAPLLARFAARFGRVSAAYDLCCGSGVIGFCLLALGVADHVTGIDISDTQILRAKAGAERNGFTGRADFLAADLATGAGGLAPAPLVVANPPYLLPGKGFVNPDPEVARARYEVTLTAEGLFRAAARLTADGGRLAVVYPAPRMGEIVEMGEAHGFGAEARWLVHPREGDPPSLAFLSFLRGREPEPTVLAPLALHPAPGGPEKYTEAAAILLGDAGVWRA